MPAELATQITVGRNMDHRLQGGGGGAVIEDVFDNGEGNFIIRHKSDNNM